MTASPRGAGASAGELRRLFDLVCDLPPPEREAALRASGADATTIARVLALLAVDAPTVARARRQLDALVAPFAGHEWQAGDVVDAWRLEREISHGGMGTVFLAQRADGHFEQRAALKLIRGMIDADAIARFAHERQLLANLQHPHIARLLDGGATASGQPYLVMEYVEGLAIDRWCRGERQNDAADSSANASMPARASTAARADLPTRLRLIESICRTLQFAHQRLIVHCDLKPSNVLVRDDGVPVLIDFGVARALDRNEADTASVPGRQFLTPRYASPEQARGEATSIASDIYSLGVLMFELVSGEAPPALPRDLEHPTLPLPIPPPSAVAAHNLPWRTRLAGDIDAIVLRACAVDPTNRYPTAQALADDIARIAAHEPIAARPATWTYVGSRLLRRRWPVFAIGAAIVALTIGFTWRTLLAERAARVAEHDAQQQAATAERTADFLVSVFGASDSDVNTAMRHDLTAREVLDAGAARIDKELAAEPRIQARLLEALGDAYRHMHAHEAAAPMLRKAAQIYLSPAVDQPLDAARCLEALANTLSNGQFPPGEDLQAARESLALAQRLTPPGSQQIANAWMVLSLALSNAGDLGGATAAGKTSLAMNEQLPDATNRVPSALHNLGNFSSENGDNAQAAIYFERALAEMTRRGELRSGARATTLGSDAHALERTGDYARALDALHEAMAINQSIYGPDSERVVAGNLAIARTLVTAGRYSEALQVATQALDGEKRISGEDSHDYINILYQLGYAYRAMGEPALALPIQRHVREVRARSAPADDQRVLRANELVATTLMDTGVASEEAHALLDDTLRAWAHLDGGTDPPYAMVAMARWHVMHGELADAATLLDQLEAPDAKSDLWVRTRAAALRADIARLGNNAGSTLEHDERAWKILHDAIGAAHPQTARYGLIWARDLRTAGQADKAEPLEKALRPVFDAAFPRDSVFRRDIAK